MKALRQLFILTGFFLTVLTNAQPRGPAPTPNDTLHSTRVLADGRVVFSI